MSSPAAVSHRRRIPRPSRSSSRLRCPTPDLDGESKDVVCHEDANTPAGATSLPEAVRMFVAWGHAVATNVDRLLDSGRGPACQRSRRPTIPETTVVWQGGTVPSGKADE